MKRLLLFLILLLGTRPAAKSRPPVRRRTACGTLPKQLPRRMKHTGAAAFQAAAIRPIKTHRSRRCRSGHPINSLPQRHARKQRTPTDDKRPKHKHTTSQIADNETRNHLHARSARLQRSPAGGLRHPARTPGKIPLVPALPAPDDLRRGSDSAAADSRMAGPRRRSRTRHPARPPPSGWAKCFPTRAEVSP